MGGRFQEKEFSPFGDKVRAIFKVPPPQNIAELRSFLGMIQYYQSFLPDLSTKLEPLHQLLRESTSWRWSKEQQASFTEVKKLLQEALVIVH